MTAITETLVTTLLAQHFSYVVLNVLGDNSPTTQIYQHLGFQTYYPFLTGKVILF